MTSKLDFTLTVPKDVNFNLEPVTQKPTLPSQTTTLSDQGVSKLQPTNKDNLIYKIFSGYLHLCSYNESAPLWRKAVAVMASLPALPFIGLYHVLERNGCIKYDPDGTYEAAENAATKKI